LTAPEWVKDAIFYQIFPDRFAKSDTVVKPANIQQWGSPPTPAQYQGGDLIGIVEHLDYLTDLGVNALYLNPIFQSASNHRYHTHDYFRVDPLLGGDDALRKLVQKAHGKGIRVILDGVFNHASRGFFQFNDILENGDASPWLDWFKVQGWPLSPYNLERPANYESWWDLRQLPKFNTDNPEVREFLMSVAEYWIRSFDVDGWRLDVPTDITTKGFWEEFRRRTKAVNSEAYLIGEIWQEAPEWLTGDRFDALMNYPLSEAIIAFLAGDKVPQILLEGKPLKPYPQIQAKEFGDRLLHLFHSYDWDVVQVQLNLVDSHDTPRLISLARGDVTTVELALLLQMTLPGSPCIYYGDEIGIRGTTDYDAPFSDVDSRWPFPWHDRSLWNDALLETFKTIIALRHDYPAFREGRFSQLYAGGSCYVFSRGSDSERLITGLNAGNTRVEVQLDVGDYFSDGTVLETVFGGSGQSCLVQNGLLRLAIPARKGVVLAPTDQGFV
jgi:cyclomaltodextrinase